VALFNEINSKGLDISQGLKKVTSDMQTHKNPTLRGTSVVPSKPGANAASAPTPKPKFGSAPVKKDPVTQLDGKKWMIEYHDGNKDISVETNMKQTVYIYKCVNSTIKVSGKVNSITLDACKKCAIVFENSVAALEVIGSQSIQAQVTGKVPIVNVDKTDGFQLYLSMESLDADIVTAKVSEVNIMIPDENGEYLEKPVVEQFRTYWDPKKKILITEPVEIAA
jgi:adenylyl cyclase-associated protein